MRNTLTKVMGSITMCMVMVSLNLCAEDAAPPIRLVDGQTAGVIPKGNVSVESRLYEGLGNGTGFLFGIAVGITDRFTLGLGYGAEGLLGRNPDPQYDPYPGCLVKYRLLDENYFLPALAVGFDYQGFGGVADRGLFGYTGYIYKSQGFFAAVSKSYLFFKTIAFGFHGDVNWSLEEADNTGWPDVWGGVDIGISKSFSFIAEYDFGLNTKDPYRGAHPYGRPQDGYLNAGFRWNITPNFAFEVDARDIFENRKYLIDPNDPHSEQKLGWSRELKIVYQAPIR
jgi:hypothetical protein